MSNCKLDYGAIGSPPTDPRRICFPDGKFAELRDDGKWYISAGVWEQEEWQLVYRIAGGRPIQGG